MQTQICPQRRKEDRRRALHKARPCRHNKYDYSLAEQQSCYSQCLPISSLRANNIYSIKTVIRKSFNIWCIHFQSVEGSCHYLTVMIIPGEMEDILTQYLLDFLHLFFTPNEYIMTHIFVVEDLTRVTSQVKGQACNCRQMSLFMSSSTCRLQRATSYYSFRISL